jgi:hypothetical protein
MAGCQRIFEGEVVPRHPLLRERSREAKKPWRSLTEKSHYASVEGTVLGER